MGEWGKGRFLLPFPLSFALPFSVILLSADTIRPPTDVLQFCLLSPRLRPPLSILPLLVPFSYTPPPTEQDCPAFSPLLPSLGSPPGPAVSGPPPALRCLARPAPTPAR